MPKTKVVEINGQSFTIAPLNMGQVEEIIDNPLPDTSKPGEYRARMWQTITNSLGNAGDTRSVDNLRLDLDLPAFNALHSEILILSGLKAATPGEFGAATVN